MHNNINNNFNSHVSGMNVEGMGGIGEKAKENIKNIINQKKLSVEEGNAYGAQIMKANGQKGNSGLQ